MAKKVKTVVKMNLQAGAANPGPPLGPALAQHKVNLMEFVNQYNERTKDQRGETLPAEITIFEDGSFTFVIKSPPTAALLLKAIGKDSGSGEPNKKKVGKVTQAQLEEIAQVKMEDLNANDIKAAAKIVAGTARSMGIEVVQ
ncbi:50S ribosomal protein L11 [candidate division WWE3 bacterium]|uniref:Large ribosomal subunit protein uL11 n=1 Tax=candidate division WWE3 bacterium TaxID=2053526 RepID=A0A955LWC3_UNCKA|nr:50S ribosomal protein L11 [candidate division WWE3 bacterium]